MRRAGPAERWAPRREEVIGPPKRQRRWSKALARHGADARSAIAAVLGVPAEQIGVRDNAG